MKLVTDTNGLLSSIPNGSSRRWLYDAFINKKFVWVFSNEIMAEYITKLRKIPNLFPPIAILTFDELKIRLGL